MLPVFIKQGVLALQWSLLLQYLPNCYPSACLVTAGAKHPAPSPAPPLPCPCSIWYAAIRGTCHSNKAGEDNGDDAGFAGEAGVAVLGGKHSRCGCIGWLAAGSPSFCCAAGICGGPTAQSTTPGPAEPDPVPPGPAGHAPPAQCQRCCRNW